MGILKELIMVAINNYFGTSYCQPLPFMSTWILPNYDMGGCNQMYGILQAFMSGSSMGFMLNYQSMMQNYMNACRQAQQMAYMQQMQVPQMQNQPAQTDGTGGVSGGKSDKADKSDKKGKAEKSDKTDKPDKTEKTDKSDKKTTPKTQTVTTELKNQIIGGTYSGDYVKINGITHYRYSDCKSSDRVSVGNGQQLHKDAAAAFNKMKEAAKKEGISLHVHSGLRTAATQKTLFSSKMKTKNRSFEQNLKWSAPSNFSEHHTGLAMDINCAESSFVNTKAYKWLKDHAKEYGFELSFPENNAQGVGFEPWHWRYVGTNGEYKSVFAAARGNDPRFS